MTDFTDEEGYGRYLDMHECYEKFINLKGVDVSTSVHICCTQLPPPVKVVPQMKHIGGSMEVVCSLPRRTSSRIIWNTVVQSA